jgi:glycosyltransferase involved in cell wall biosynthesis
VKFSVVIPVFNGEATVLRAVASVLAQSTPAAEVVEQHFPTVQVVTQENSGQGAARNAGVRATTTDWIAFLDADDAGSGVVHPPRFFLVGVGAGGFVR